MSKKSKFLIIINSTKDVRKHEGELSQAIDNGYVFMNPLTVAGGIMYSMLIMPDQPKVKPIAQA